MRNSLVTFGDIILDVSVALRSDINIGTDTECCISHEAGGSAANFAAWASFIGGDVLFIGRVGDDCAGDFLEKELLSHHVKSHLIRDKTRNTGTIVLFVSKDGERTMLTDRGANIGFIPEDIPSEAFTNYSHMHITGYSLFGGGRMCETAEMVLNRTKSVNMTVSIDPSSSSMLLSFGIDRFIRITKGADFIFPNLEEGCSLTGQSEPDKIVRSLSKYYRHVILKLGADGFLMGCGEKMTHHSTKTKAQNPDTTGAGDAFAAGFICGYLREGDLIEAGALAMRCGLKCSMKKGGRPPRHSPA